MKRSTPAARPTDELLAAAHAYADARATFEQVARAGGNPEYVREYAEKEAIARHRMIRAAAALDELLGVTS